MKISDVDTRELKQNIKLLNELKQATDDSIKTITDRSDEIIRIADFLESKQFKEVNERIKENEKYLIELIDLTTNINKELEEQREKFKEAEDGLKDYNEIVKKVIDRLLQEDSFKVIHKQAIEDIETRKRILKQHKEFIEEEHSRLKKHIRMLHQKAKKMLDKKNLQLSESQKKNFMESLGLEETELESKKRNTIFKVLSIASLVISIISAGGVVYLILNTAEKF